jgi:hypothetical protein
MHHPGPARRGHVSVNCPECDDYELRRDHWLTWMLRQLLQGPSRRSFGLDLGAIARALVGSPAGPTHYERHRAGYAATGDERELARMLRQVTL